MTLAQNCPHGGTPVFTPRPRRLLPILTSRDDRHSYCRIWWKPWRMRPGSAWRRRRYMRGKRVIIFKSPRERGEEEAGAESDFSPLTALDQSRVRTARRRYWRWAGKDVCRSPGITGAVPRYSRIVYRGYAPNGEAVEREATNFSCARPSQHEIDHLDGVLFPMRMDRPVAADLQRRAQEFLWNMPWRSRMRHANVADEGGRMKTTPMASQRP